MRKILTSIIIFMVTIILASCSKDVIKENKEKINNEESTKSSNVAEKDSNVSGDEKKDASLIIKKIEEMQKENNIIDLVFFGDNMYAVLNSSENTEIIKINIENWDEKSVKIDVKDIDKITIQPCKDGLTVKERIMSDVSNNYVYNNDLQCVTEFTGILVDYSKGDNEIFYYDSYEKAIIRESLINHDKYIEREIMDYEKIKSGDLMFITDATMSYDGRYIYYAGGYLLEDESEDCWGVFDLLDSSKDIMYLESKKVVSSENNTIIMDSRAGKDVYEQLNFMDKKYVCYNSKNEKNEMCFQNEREADTGTISNEGNIMITAFNEDLNTNRENISIYDTTSGKVITSFKDDDRIWIKNGIVCEKYGLVIGLDAIHETEDYFSPTGKYNVYYLKY